MFGFADAAAGEHARAEVAPPGEGDRGAGGGGGEHDDGHERKRL